MTATPPDPDPSRVPGLEPGGGVPPGSTPPDSAQTSGALADHQLSPKRRLTPLALVSIIAVVIFVLAFVAIAAAVMAHVP